MNAYTEKRPSLALASVVALALLVSGCASFSGNGAMSPVAASVDQEINTQTRKIVTPADARSAQQAVKAILARTLDAESAVQVALLSNRALQAQYNALGVAEADYVEATLPANPVLSLGKLISGEGFELEASLAASLLSLFTLEGRQQVAALRFEAAQHRAVLSTFQLAAATRKAFYTAVAARQRVSFLEQAREASGAIAELMQKLGETGATTRLEQARANALYLEVSNQLAAARMHVGLTREDLIRQMGLWGGDLDFRLPGSLPSIPDKVPTSRDVEAVAISKRVDLAIARLELDALGRSLGIQNATRSAPMLELAGLLDYSASADGADQEIGFALALDVEWEVPIFDFKQVNGTRATEQYMAAVNSLAALAVNIRSEVRAAYLRYRSTYDISWQYRNKILPMRKIVVEESLLEYNGMIADVFELLTSATENVESNIAAIDAKLEFFLGAVDFQSAVIGGGSGEEGGGDVELSLPSGEEE